MFYRAFSCVPLALCCLLYKTSILQVEPALSALEGSVLTTGRSEKSSVSLVAQSCPTFCNPMDYTVHGVLQAKILEWVAFPFFPTQGSTQVSRIAGGFFTS